MSTKIKDNLSLLGSYERTSEACIFSTMMPRLPSWHLHLASLLGEVNISVTSAEHQWIFFSPVFSDSLVTLILLKPWNPLTFWALTFVSGSLSKHTPAQSPHSLGTFGNGKFPCFASFLQAPHTLEGEKKLRFLSPFPRLDMLLGYQPYIASLSWLIWHAREFPLPS